MSNMESFKNIISSERKRMGMTQEEFANLLGITPQAVSKWENGVGLPDVTLFPAIAKILNVPIGRLFNESEERSKQDAIPKTYEGLALICMNGSRACYSSKAAVRFDEALGRCEFEDGSEADLNGGTVINRGRGEVRIYNVKDVVSRYRDAFESTATSLTWEGAHFEDVEISSSLSCSTKLLFDASLKNKCTVRAEGDPAFIAALCVEQLRDALIVRFNSENTSHGQGRTNKLTILTDAKYGRSIKASISGSGAIEVVPEFESAAFSIAGSGQILAGDCGDANIRISGSGSVCLKDVKTKVGIHVAGSGDVSLGKIGGTLTTAISGSGDVTAESAAAAECRISGCGDIAIKELTESLTVNIHGGGDVSCGGTIRKLDLRISGNGDFNGKNLTVENANINVKGESDIHIGKILGTSVEQLGKDCKLTVDARGKN